MKCQRRPRTGPGLLALAAVLGATLVALSATAQGVGRPRDLVLPADMQPLSQLSAVSGRPGSDTFAVSVLSVAGGQAAIEYGRAPGQYPQQTAPVACAPGVPVEITLSGLSPDSDVFYRARVGDAVTAEQHCHTQRPPGSTFAFEVQGDSHPERPQMFDADLYAQTLRAAAADRPDFYMTIGDDFSVDTLRDVTRDAVDRVYRTQRLFLDLVGAPLFLVNGNHEQAALCNLDGTANCLGVWAGTVRNRYFPLPVPDSFYTGDTHPVEHVGLLRDYYAWTWGDALFVVIDPYWHSAQAVDNERGTRVKGTRDLWDVTLGEAQYQWLRQTLEQSHARYKFVFAHHVTGTGRGGVEMAGLYEWGGSGRRGAWEFDWRRPGWGSPVHQPMARNGVSVFFQGHDHIFVKQELDGVVYQTLPLPADPYATLYNRDAYRSGDALPGSGRLRVTVSPEKAQVAYVRSCLPRSATPEHPDGEVAYQYEVAPAP